VVGKGLKKFGAAGGATRARDVEAERRVGFVLLLGHVGAVELTPQL